MYMSKLLSLTLGTLVTLTSACIFNDTNSNCIHINSLNNITQSNISFPIVGYIYQTYINCFNFTCHYVENYVPLMDA